MLTKLTCSIPISGFNILLLSVSLMNLVLPPTVLSLGPIYFRNSLKNSETNLGLRNLKPLLVISNARAPSSGWHPCCVQHTHSSFDNQSAGAPHPRGGTHVAYNALTRHFKCAHPIFVSARASTRASRRVASPPQTQRREC